MKNLLLTTVVATLLQTCSMKSEDAITTNLFQRDGKGIIKNKQFVMNMDEIKVAQSIKAVVVKSNTEKVVISAPADIIDDVVVKNDDGEVYIRFKPGLKISARNVSAKIFVKDFSKLEATSSAEIKISDKFTQDRTEVEVSSSARISGHLEANELSIEASSSGRFTGEVWAVKLQSEATSSGKITISGKVKKAKFEASSSGAVDARKVIVEVADINASSSGSVSASVKNQLKASASSSGNISIERKGNLNILSQEQNSGGKISIR